MKPLDHTSPFILISLILLQITPCLSLSTSTYEIRDLEETANCFLTSEVNLWTITPQKVSTVATTICDQSYLLGGYDVLGTLGVASDPTDGAYSKTFTIHSGSLTSHSAIYFTLTLWAVDSWDLTDFFKINIDGTVLNGPFLDYTKFPSDICGRVGLKDSGPIRVFGKMTHTSATLAFKLLKSMADNTNEESVGFRDLNLLIVTGALPSTFVSNSICVTPTSLISGSGGCPCPEGQFQKSSGNCIPCHSACSSCFGATEAECYQCAPGSSFVNGKCTYCHSSCELCNGPNADNCITCQPGRFLFQLNRCIPECALPYSQATTPQCVNTCSSPCSATQYMDWNNACQNTCAPPLRAITTLDNILKCVYPCNTGEYLYWDSSCETTCPPPLSSPLITTTGGVAYCNYPSSCTFLYWDSTCQATCDPPLVQRFKKGKAFCEYPCSSSEFLKYDGTCIASCDSPYVSSTSNTKKYCAHPCPSIDDFIKWDGTCITSCLPPFQQYAIGDLNYCVRVCPTGQYALTNGTCITSCESPLTVQSQPYGDRCLLPCSNPLDYYYPETGECKSTCNSYSIVEQDLYFTCQPYPEPVRSGLLVDLLLIAPDDKGTPTFIMLSPLTEYIRYMNVNFPQRLEDLLESQGRTIISLRLGLSMTKSMQESFPKHTLPEVFNRIDLHSSFLVNYWQELTSLWIALGIGIVLFLTNMIASRFELKTVQMLYRAVGFIAMWNFVLVLLATSIDDIILYAALEFQTFEADSFLSVISLILSIFMLVASIGILFFSGVLSSKAKNIKENSSSVTAYKEFVSKWQGSQVLFRGYKTYSKFTYLFYVIYILRHAIPMIVATTAYEHPLVQAIFYLVISVLIVLYIAITQPMEAQINNAQVLIIEFIVLAVNICLVILVVLDQDNREYEEISIFIGDFIILANVCLNLLIIAFLAAKIFIGISHALKLRKKESNNEKAAWVHLLMLPVQQGGMGFEEATMAEPPNRSPVEIPDHSILMSSARKELINMNESQLTSDRLMLDMTRDGASLYREHPARNSIDLFNYSRQVKGIEPEGRKKMQLESDGTIKNTKESVKYNNKVFQQPQHEEVMMLPEFDERGNINLNYSNDVTRDQSGIFGDGPSNSRLLARASTPPLETRSEKVEKNTTKLPTSVSPMYPSQTAIRRASSHAEQMTMGDRTVREVIQEQEEEEQAENNEDEVQVSRVQMDMNSTLRSDKTLRNTVEGLEGKKEAEASKEGKEEL